MADEDRDAESSTDDETTVSDDVADTDSGSRGDDADEGDVLADDADADADESESNASAADTEPVYGRVTPRDETVTAESADSSAENSEPADTADSEAHADEDDADSATDGESDSDAADVDSEDSDEDAETGDDDDEDAESDADDGEDVEPDSDADEDAESDADDGEDVESDADDDEEAESDADADEDAESDADDDEVAVGPTDEGIDPYDPSTALDDDGLVGSAPESDREMPLTDHIEEMIRRLAVVFGVAGVITLILFPGADILNAYVNTGLPSATDVINFLWNTHIPAADQLADRRPRLYGPLELILTKLKVAGLAGTVIGLPVFVYETYLFMRPGLYQKERKYYLAAVPTSLVLALIGVTFAHFVVLPAIFAYFTSYTEGTAVIAFGLKETFNLILILMGYMAVVFQIPLFVELAIMMNLVTRQWLEDRRLLFWGAFLGLAFLVSPDPTGMAPIIIAATMITLFEGTLAVLRWTGN